MSHRIACVVLVVLGIGGLAVAQNQAPVTLPAGGSAEVSPATQVSTTQPATQSSTQPATQPTTQPDEVNFDLLRQYLTGEKKLTPEEAVRLEFWVNLLKDMVLGVMGFIPKLFAALIFLFFFYLLYRGLRKVILGGMGRAGVDESIRDLLGMLLKWLVLGFGVIIAFNQIGIQITALLTGVSIIGLAIGFAAQETLANLIAGIVIFWDRPFKIGDWVEIDGAMSQVQRVTFRSTRMLDGDGKMVVYPNTRMLSNRLVNKSANPSIRVRVPISIAYKESTDAARSVLLRLVEGDDRILATPYPMVVVSECAASGVDLQLRFWIKDERQEFALRSEYLEKAKKALTDAGIEIPFPHVQLMLGDTPALSKLAQGRAA